MKHLAGTFFVALTLALTLADSPAAAGSVTVDGQFVSTVPTGTPPLAVDSATLVPNLNASFLDGLPASAFSIPVAHVVRVGISGGEFTSIQAALDSITDASYYNAYVVLVGPGTYYESITLKDYVTVRGFGRGSTILDVSGSGAVTAVTGSAQAKISDLTIVASSSDGDAVGLASPFAIARNVEIFVSSSATGSSTGVRVTGSATVQLVDCDVQANGGSVNSGLYVDTPAQVTIDGGTLIGFGGGTPTSTDYGIRRAYVSGTGTLSVTGTEVSGEGGSVGYGLRSEKGSLSLDRCSVFAGGSSQATAFYNDENSVYSMSNSSFSTAGSAPAASQVALQQAAGTASVARSTIFAPNAAAVSAGAQLRLAYDEINGSLTGTGTYACLGNYDAGVYPISCP